MKKIIVTFAGRKSFLEILFKYILKYKHHIDEYYIYLCTNNQEDIEFITDFYEKNKDFVKLFRTEDFGIDIGSNNRPAKFWNLSWRNCQDENSVYLRLDDDIVYFEESLLTEFLDFRINNKENTFVYPLIFNNIYSNWILQEKIGIEFNGITRFDDNWNSVNYLIKNYLDNNPIPERISDVIPERFILCPTSWGNIDFCISVHNKLLDSLESGNIQHFKNSKDGSTGLQLNNTPPMSINCVSWLGETMKEILIKYSDFNEEEPWATIYLPVLTNKPNYVYYNTVVGHFSYYKQIEMGLLNTNILTRYNNICKKICD